MQLIEAQVLYDITEALGAEPDLRIFRNTVGTARTFNPTTGKMQYIKYGLGTGSADIVGILRRPVGGTIYGVWFCLEVKRPGEKPRIEQQHWATAMRWMGAFVGCATSVEEALSALNRARAGLLE